MTDHPVQVRRDATWQKLADGFVTSSDGKVRLRIIERRDGNGYDIIEQTATGTKTFVIGANTKRDAEWELDWRIDKETPAYVAFNIEIAHGKDVDPEDCILRSGVEEETEQTKLVTDGGVEEDSGTAQSASGIDRYVIGDALAELDSLESESAAVVCLDDAWARPGRQGEFGVEYPTHDLEGTREIVAACWRVLKPGGWLVADADDWLAPRLETHIREEYGDVTATGDYDGGGYRRRGSVTYVDASGDPDRSTAGMYLANAGYSVIFAHKGETSRRTTQGARQVARQPRRVEPGYPYGWGSVKPIEPYRNWIEGLTDVDELVVVPCAGTAPAAIAAEDLGREFLAIDSEPEAREAYRRRREAHLEGAQTTLVQADGGRNTRSEDTGMDREGSQ